MTIDELKPGMYVVLARDFGGCVTKVSARYAGHSRSYWTFKSGGMAYCLRYEGGAWLDGEDRKVDLYLAQAAGA